MTNAKAKLSECSNTRRKVLLSLALLLVAGYSLFQARFLILGPQIKIVSPSEVSVDAEAVMIEGEAKNAAWLELNGRQIFTDENGLWSEKLIVSKGLSIMTVKARDRFGRVTEKRVSIYLN